MIRVALAVAVLCAAASPALAATVRITLQVQVPRSTPAGAALFASGNLPALGNWSGSGLPLARLGDGRYSGALEVEQGSTFRFKITRGSWDTVEKDAAGREIADRPCLAQRDDTLRVTVGAWRDQVEGPAAARAHTLTGTIDTLPAIHSKFVRDRQVLVYLPPGYAANPATRYPVLYFHDGNNVFDAATSFLGIEWGVDETAERLIRAGRVPPFLAVAVANTAERSAEYTPAADPRHGGGRAGDYARYLLEELKPRLDSLYRTLPDAAHTGVVGSSLGGIVSLWLGLEHPEAFSRVGCVSPAAWWADHDIVRRARTANLESRPRVWLDIGTAEEPLRAGHNDPVEGARSLRDALLERGWREGSDLHYEEAPGAAHNEAAWAARVGPLLEFLLAP